MARSLHRAILCGAILVAVADAGFCPVRNCAAAGASLVQTNSTVGRARSLAKASGQDKADSTYEVDYTPGHFICMKCDAAACRDCSVICDLKSCIGEFYSQECWCSQGGGGQEQRVLCDGSCNGGLCDTPGLTCQRREDACTPWWWCGAPPPKSFLQQRSSLRRLSELSSRAKAKAAQRRSAASAGSLAQLAAEAGDASKVAGMTFRDSKYVCTSGALPPKVRDPATLLWVHQGYIVLDQSSCEGATFTSKCYCWDNYRNLLGKDPLTSQFVCDSGCGMGPCEGRTCGLQPPTPPPKGAPPPPRVPLPRLPMDMHVAMESVDAPVTQRSPHE